MLGVSLIIGPLNKEIKGTNMLMLVIYSLAVSDFLSLLSSLPLISNFSTLREMSSVIMSPDSNSESWLERTVDWKAAHNVVLMVRETLFSS